MDYEKELEEKWRSLKSKSKETSKHCKGLGGLAEVIVTMIMTETDNTIDAMTVGYLVGQGVSDVSRKMSVMTTLNDKSPLGMLASMLDDVSGGKDKSCDADIEKVIRTKLNIPKGAQVIKADGGDVRDILELLNNIEKRQRESTKKE